MFGLTCHELNHLCDENVTVERGIMAKRLRSITMSLLRESPAVGKLWVGHPCYASGGSG